MVPLFLVIGVQENLMGQRMHVFFYLLQPPRGCKGMHLFGRDVIVVVIVLMVLMVAMVIMISKVIMVAVDIMVYHGCQGHKGHHS